MPVHQNPVTNADVQQRRRVVDLLTRCGTACAGADPERAGIIRSRRRLTRVKPGCPLPARFPRSFVAIGTRTASGEDLLLARTGLARKRASPTIELPSLRAATLQISRMRGYRAG